MTLMARATRTGATRPHALWHSADHVALCIVNLLCAAGVLTCWVNAAVHVHWHPQVPWLEGATIAALTAALADSMWLLSGMRRIRDRRSELQPAVEALPMKTGRPTPDKTYVTGERMTAYHLAGCLLVQGKRVRTAAVSELERSNHHPCRMCIR